MEHTLRSTLAEGGMVLRQYVYMYIKHIISLKCRLRDSWSNRNKSGGAIML